jgi:hypothetical protein
LTAKERAAAERKAKQEERRLKRERLRVERKAKAEEKKQKREELRAKRREAREKKRAKLKAKAEEKKHKRAELRARKAKEGNETDTGGAQKPEDSAGSESTQAGGSAIGAYKDGDSPYSGSPNKNQETQTAASDSKPAPGTNASIQNSTDSDRSLPTLDTLLTYLSSQSSAVRLKAVKDIVKVPDARATRALEERMLEDSSIQVRIAAVEGLVDRKSVESVPLIHRAVMTSSNTTERAALQKAIRRLTGTDRIHDILPESPD